jgi:hypothetical protein
MTLALSAPWAAGEFTVCAPEGWSLKPGQAPDGALHKKPGGYATSVPVGPRAIELQKKWLPRSPLRKTILFPG